MKTGDWNSYQKVEMIYINSSTTTQKYYSRVTTGSTIVNNEYDAYILFEKNVNEYLCSERDKKKLTQKVSELGTRLEVSIIDNTGEEE